MNLELTTTTNQSGAGVLHGHHVISNAKYGCKHYYICVLMRLLVDARVISICQYCDRKQHKLEFEAAM